MSQVRCEQVSEGLRPSEAVAILADLHGRRHYLRVEREFLDARGDGTTFLPIGVVHRDARSDAVLIELPHEAETGANRLWVRSEQLDAPSEVLA